MTPIMKIGTQISVQKSTDDVLNAEPESVVDPATSEICYENDDSDYEYFSLAKREECHC